MSQFAVANSRIVKTPRPGDGIVRATVADLIAQRDKARALSLKHLRRSAEQAGSRRSMYRARGMDYEESRRYQSGDDMRNLDWRVMARTGTPYTKLYREERERPVYVCLDLGPSMFFATRGSFKAVVAARCAALMAWTVIEHGDRVGGIVFSAAGDFERRPQRGMRGTLGLFNDICAERNWQPSDETGGADLDGTVQRIARVVRPGSLVVLVSDFSQANDETMQKLRQIAVHSDLLNILIYDPLERELPSPGRYPIADRGARWILDSRSARNRARHRERFANRLAHMDKLYASCAARCVQVATDDDPALILARGLHGVLR